MAGLDLQKVALRRLLDTSNHEFYTRLVNKYFSGANLLIFSKIQTFYKANLRLPTIEEFSSMRKDDSIQEYLESQILKDENSNVNIRDEFLLSQLQDFFIREETLDFLTLLLEEFENLEKSEIIDKFQRHLLELNHAIPISEELYDIGELDMFPKMETFKMHPSGLSAEYDAINGGFGQSELVLLGGRRGSGKSILALNCAYKRYLLGNTVAFFSIEMRYKEVYDRLMSIISGVPFLDILLNKTTFEQKIQMARSKFDVFFEPSPDFEKMLDKVIVDKDFDTFTKEFKEKKFTFKPNRLFLIDDPALTINRVDHFCNMFSVKYPRFNMKVVDYINIVREPKNKEWQVQIDISESLKLLSRKYDITCLSPYQIDDSGEARFAKGILDSADRAFIFFPPEKEDANQIRLHSTKIRNGKAISVDVPINWETLTVLSEADILTKSRPLNVDKYGTDGEPNGNRPKETFREI